MTKPIERPETVLPDAEASRLAAESRQILARHSDGDLRVRIDNKEEMTLPKSIVDLLNYLLDQVATGNAVTVIPVHAELTTQEAADILNVSRPHIVKLIKEKKLPHHMVGSHRRIRFTDLKAYDELAKKRRAAALEELAREAQELEMGY